MSMLPEAFAELAPFVELWAVEGEAARASARSSRSAEERRAFYDAAQPQLSAALDYLDGRKFAELSGADLNLARLTLSLAHVALAVEVLGSQESRHALSRDKLIMVRHSMV